MEQLGKFFYLKITVDDSYYSEDSPTITRLDAKDMNVFGTMPLKEDIVVIKCKQCSRPLLASQFKDHLGKRRAPKKEKVTC